jgi:hypothetical protein
MGLGIELAIVLWPIFGFAVTTTGTSRSPLKALPCNPGSQKLQVNQVIPGREDH